jgi:hypothetical protein
MLTLNPKLIATAAVLSVALLVTGCAEDDPTAEPTPTPSTPSESDEPTESTSPSESATEEPPPSGTTTRLTAEGLDEGAPPAIAYLAADDPTDPADHWHLVRADGSELEIPGHGGVFSFALMGDGLVTLNDEGSGAEVAVVDGNGDEVSGASARGYGLAVTPNGKIVAYLGKDGAPQFIEDGGAKTGGLRKVPGAGDIGAIRGEDTCFESESIEGGCTAFVNSADASGAFVSTSHGIVDRAGDMVSVADVSPTGLVLGLSSIEDGGSCSAVWKAFRPKPRWETCDHTLLSFSPDGSRELGTDPYLDGLGQRTLAFLDDSGAVEHSFEGGRKGPFVIQTAWEDDEHVLAVVYDVDAGWAVLRLGVDGSQEYAVAPVPGDETERPFGLPAD